MNKKKRILVLTDKMPWGHRSIARAIYGHLLTKHDNNIEVFYEEAEIPFSIINDVYTLLYRYLPSTNRISHRLMENDAVRKLFFEMVDLNDQVDLHKIIKRTKPDVVVCAYFFLSHALVKLQKSHGYKYKIITVVADPWTMNPISFVPEADANLIYDEVGIATGLKYGVEKNRLVKTGWWVRNEMNGKNLHSASVKLQMKKKLGFTDDRPVVFVGGGSLGTNALIKFLPALLLVKTKVGVIFNTGTDKMLNKTVDQYIKLFKRLRRDNLVQIKNLGWIDNMADILSGCDIVFGKAGPNFLFDVVAMEKPFVAITHIGGQEDGNIEIIKKKKLGWVREKGGSATKFFLKYLEHPEKYNKKYAESIRREAKNNQMGLEKVWQTVKKEMSR